MPGHQPARYLVALLLVFAPASLAGESSIFEKVARQRNAQAAVAPASPAPQSKASKAAQHPAPSSTQKNQPPPGASKRSPADETAPEEQADDSDDSASEEGDDQVTLAAHYQSVRESPYLNGEPVEQEAVIEPPFAISDPDAMRDADVAVVDHPRPLVRKIHKLGAYLRRPMKGQSWLSRPMSAGFVFGGIWGGELIPHKVNQTSGELLIFNAGWDHTNYDGYEVRIGGSTIHAFNEQPPYDPRITRFGLFDFSALLYPWGDARLRPYGRLGIGLHNYQFVDHTGQQVRGVVPAMLIGGGIKYLFQRHCAFRLEFLDNIGFGSGINLNTIHNTSLVFGMEYRFGGMHKNYWPWSSGRLIW